MRIDHKVDVESRRKQEYPTITELLEAMAAQHQGNSAPMDALMQRVQAVQKKYPK